MIGRRSVLRVFGQTVTAAGLGAFTAGCPYAKSAASGPIPAGHLRDVPPGHFAFVKDRPVVLARDERGLYALSAVCTHWGCDMQKDGKIGAEGVVCTCHGSRFDKAGKVLEGPADAPLAHFHVVLSSSGEIVVDAGVKVSEEARTPVPA